MIAQSDAEVVDVTDRYLHWIRRCPLRPIRSQVGLERAISTIDALSDQGERTEEEHDYLIVLALLIEQYETVHYPMGEDPDTSDPLLRV